MIDARTGHVCDVLLTMPSASVHTVVTSPPYFGLRDYGLPPARWEDGWVGCLGLEDTPDQYVEHLCEVFDATARVLRPDGTLWLNLGDSYAGGGGGNYSKSRKQTKHGEHVTNVRNRPAWLTAARVKRKDLLGIPWRVAFALQARGWYLRQSIVWHKPNPMPESVTDRCTRAHEMLFMLAHPDSRGRYFYDSFAIREPSVMKPQRRSKPHKRRVPGRGSTGQAPDTFSTTEARGEPAQDFPTRNKRDVWTIAPKPFKGAHFAVMPEDLADHCVKAGSSEHGVCAACGTPYKRLVKDASVAANQRLVVTETMLSPPSQASAGWGAQCSCAAGVRPAVVLDPFGGAGTVALVAARADRDSIYIDASSKYLEGVAKPRWRDEGVL